MSMSIRAAAKLLLTLAAIAVPSAAFAQTTTFCAGTGNGCPGSGGGLSPNWQLFGAANPERNTPIPGQLMIDQVGFGTPNYAVLTVTLTAGTYNLSAALETEYPRALFVEIGNKIQKKGNTSTLVIGEPTTGFLVTGDDFKIPVEWNIGSVVIAHTGTYQLAFGNPTTTGQTDRCPYISAVTFTKQ